MNIPEELRDPRTAVRRIYRWMLTILLIVGGATSILLFLVLEPEQLVGQSGYLLAVLGETVVGGVTGVGWLGRAWSLVIVANAALMLIGATNTGFAGARGLWVTMARDNLLPRFVLRPNARGSFERVHWLMLLAVLALCGQAGADIEILERWYGATFGLVMFSGLVAFVLLRRFKGAEPRPFLAGPNVMVGKTRVPVGALIGLAFLGMALLGLYDQYQEQIETLETLLLGVVLGVCGVLLAYNHRRLIRAGYRYLLRVVGTEEEEALHTEDDVMVVAVGGARLRHLIRAAITTGREWGGRNNRQFRRLVVFHMTDDVRGEHVYRVSAETLRPVGLPDGAVRIFTELTEVAVPDLEIFLVLAPNPSPDKPGLAAAMDALVGFHDRHAMEGHLFMMGAYGVDPAVALELDERLGASALVTVPV